MEKKYKGIKLINLNNEVQFSHSNFMQMITNNKVEEDKNIEYVVELLNIPKGHLSEDQFNKISALNSVINMNYQTCNGGIGQYFDNGFHEYREPGSDEDVAQLNQEDQVEMFFELYNFAKEVFPENETENEKLLSVIKDFENIYMDSEEVFEWIESEEDEEIWDEEKEEWVENPDYFEPYEESVGFQDVLQNDYGFDDKFYEVNDYLENLIEAYAQYLYKEINLENIKEKSDIDTKIFDAGIRANDQPKHKETHKNEPEIDDKF